MVNITVNGLKNFITFTDAENAYAVQIDDNKNNQIKSFTESEKKAGVKLPAKNK